MNAQLRRRIMIVTIGAVVASALVYGFLPKPVVVDVVIAARGPLRVTVEEEGRTRVKDRFVVSAPVPGYLRRIALEVGDPVHKGQRVALLEPLRSSVLDPRSRAGAEAAVAAAQATLAAAEEKEHAAAADEEYANIKLERNRNLFAGAYISRDNLDQAESDAKRAEAFRLSSQAAVVAARADLERARTVLGYSAADRSARGGEMLEVRSPVSGRVLKLHRESEGVLNAGDPLLDIGDPQNMEVKVEVLSADAVRLRKGTPVLFERWGEEKPLTGKVRVVEPAGFTKISSLGVEEQRVLVIVDLSSPVGSREGLGDAYRLDTSFILWEGANVLQTPASALFRHGDGWAVFVVENRKARLRPVQVGQRNGLAAEIVSGVKEGEPILAHPDDSIKEGIAVRVR